MIEHVRDQPGAKEMGLSFVPGEHAPAAFCHRLGFIETGVEDDGELEMKLIFGETEGG